MSDYYCNFATDYQYVQTEIQKFNDEIDMHKISAVAMPVC